VLLLLTRTVNTLARKLKILKEGDPNLQGEHVREGLSAVVAVKVRALLCDCCPAGDRCTEGPLLQPYCMHKQINQSINGVLAIFCTVSQLQHQ
jgi:hypothetical protein